MKELRQVLVINDHGYVNGGISRVALESSRALAERGLDVTFFSSVAGPQEELDFSGLKMRTIHQPEFLADPNRARGLGRAFWNRGAEKAVGALADSLDPEHSIVHVHSWAQANSASIFAPLLRKKVRLIVSLHDYFIACPNGAFTVFPRAAICGVKPLSLACLGKNCDSRSRLHKLFKFGRAWVQGRIARAPAGIRNFIFVSSFNQRMLHQYLPPTAQTFLLPNPIDLPKGAPSEVGNNSAWAFVGRLSREKGARLFAEAAARLKLESLFIGEGEEAGDIRKANPEARMLGWLERGPLLATMTQARGIVFPSLCLESQPLVVHEALALGLPVIVSSETAAAELVEHGETGLVFRKNDVEDLVLKIRQLEENPELRSKMGRQAFERYWSQPPTLEKHVDRLLEIYRAVE